MNYIEFKKELKELVKKELGRDVQISFEVVEKNNGKSEESIVFYKQKEYSQIVVGLPGLYEIYRTTENMRYSFERILDILRRGERISVDEAFCDWERIKGLISMRLINLEWNKNMLKTVNTDVVLKEEWLSNELYYFSREGGVVTMI